MSVCGEPMTVTSELVGERGKDLDPVGRSRHSVDRLSDIRADERFAQHVVDRLQRERLRLQQRGGE